MREAPGLAPEGFKRLNESFYASCPHDYFSRRLGSLLLEAAKPKELQDLFDAGVEVGKFRAGRREDAPPRSPEETEEDEKRRVQFVHAEAVALLHHAAENVLRLYLAHLGKPLCPWLELARIRTPGAFKRRVEEAVINARQDDPHRAELALVFSGTESPTREAREERPSRGVSERDWSASLDAVDSWLRYFGRAFLGESDLYNSVKHGLAIQSGDVAFRIVPEGSETAVLGADGPAITFLELDDERHWRLATKWVNMEETLLATTFAIYLMENTFTVGRARYLGQFPTDGQVRFYAGSSFTEVMDLVTRSGIDRFAMRLPYYKLAADGSDAAAIRP